ncbi:MAG: acylphosphatase [Candidatus Saganbacteria bacterium]|nr:acylphosphatase [Candidatus Saganbacteria bacterium]
MAQKRLELTYSGPLANVNFRDQAEHFATAHHLTGFARNLSDGRIKVVAEGEERELQDFLSDFNEYLEIFGALDHYSKNWFPATGEFNSFRLWRV